MYYFPISGLSKGNVVDAVRQFLSYMAAQYLLTPGVDVQSPYWPDEGFSGAEIESERNNLVADTTSF